MFGDDLLERHEPHTVGHHHEPGQQVGDLDPGEPMVATDGIVDHHCEVQREIGDVRERMTGIDGQRREHREDPVVEIGLQMRPVGVVEIGERAEDHAGLGEFGDELVEEHRLGTSTLQLQALADLAQLGAGRAPVGGAVAEAGGHLILQAGDAHLEELIEVLREDRHELEPFEQWHRRVGREGEHAGVEVQPGQFPVQEAVRGVDRVVDGVRDGPRTSHRRGGGRSVR